MAATPVAETWDPRPRPHRVACLPISQQMTRGIRGISRRDSSQDAGTQLFRFQVDDSQHITAQPTRPILDSELVFAGFQLYCMVPWLLNL